MLYVDQYKAGLVSDSIRGADVTVIVGTHNGMKHLGAQLASITQQTVLPHKVIISDDGSDDDTLALAREFAETAPFLVDVVEHERRGVSANFLGATQGATTPWLAWCDQDDVWYPNKIESCLAVLNDVPDAVLVFHGADLVDDDLKPLGRRLPQPRGYRLGRFEGARWGCFHGFATMFDRRLLDGVDPADIPRSVSHKGAWHHDELIHELARLRGTRVIIHEPLAAYRRHERNESADPTLVTLNGRLTTKHSRGRYLQQVRDINSWIARTSELAQDASIVRYAHRLLDDEQMRATAWAHPRVRVASMSIVSGVFRGSYRSRRRGGHGLTALAMDIVTLLRRTKQAPRRLRGE